MTEPFVDFEMPASTDEHWQITSDQEAEWCLMKMAEAQATVAHHEAERAKAIEKWDRYVEGATREAQWDNARLEAKLQGYLLSLRASGKLGNKKSYRLPSARLQLRAVDAKWDVQSGDLVNTWAQANQILKTVVQPDLTQIKRLCADGVEVPGMIQTRQAGEAFSVIFPKDEKYGEVQHG